MAIELFTQDELVTEIRRRYGETDTSNTTITDAEIDALMNLYLQRLPRRASQVLQGEGLSVAQGCLRLDQWLTVVNSTAATAADNLTITAGSAQVWMPQNMDKPVSLIDRTTGRKVHIVTKVKRYWADRFDYGPDENDVVQPRQGPPEYLELLGFTTGDSSWRAEGKLWPETPAGVTPSLELTYWRLPAIPAAGTSPMDIDPKFQDVLIYGVMAEILRDDDPAYERYAQLEKEVILEMAKVATFA